MRLTESLVLLALLTGCSSEPSHDTPNDGGASCTRGVWKATSSRIEIRTFQFFKGSSGYWQDRSLLTEAQLAALDGLCVIPTPTDRVADSETHRITVTDDDGTQTSYRASEGNMLEGNEGLPTVDIHSLDPFLATFSCLYARQAQRPPGDDAGPPWSKAPTMGTDSGCLNGVYVASGCAEAWVKLKVDAPITPRIEAYECEYARPTLRLLTPDGSTELAVSDPGSGNLCPYLSYAFTQVETYLMRIDKTGGTGCDAGTALAGDILLRVRP